MPGLPEVSSPQAPALTQFVLKVHGRCNLSCDHCYLYEHADQGWRSRPRLMSSDTVRAAAARIAEHALAHRLRVVHVILHGGEPLLLGADRLREVLTELRTAIEPVTLLDLRMQTNGVLLTPAICNLLADNDVKVGVSLDGDLHANDLHRRFPDGSSSHAAVLRGLALLRRPAYRHSYAGILCTVDLANDPIRVYEALLAQRPPRLDFLLPHATWDRPPERGDRETPYSDWLMRIWRRWITDGRPVPIRLFDSLLAAGSGGQSGTEAVGLDPADLAVIETDGSWEQLDSLKTAYEGAAATGYDVFRHPVDELLGHPGIARRQTGLADLSPACRACPVVRQCGGGLFPHRYRSTNGFDNPSVYCPDLKELITTMERSPLRPVTEVRAVERSVRDTSDPLVEPPADVLAQIDDFATGYGDPASFDRVTAYQASVNQVLLVAVAEGVGKSGALAADAWQLLLRLDEEAPQAVGRVLAHPFVRTWAVGRLTTTPVVAAGLDHLGCLAAAVAIHAGIRVDLDVPVVDGTIVLPTLGALGLDGSRAGTASISTRPAGFTVRTGGRVISVDLDTGGPASWQARRSVRADTLVLPLEDVDPHRDAYHWPAAARLPDRSAAAFSSAMAEAVRLLRQDLPGHEPGLRAALRAVVPLRLDSTGRLRSATARQAFGAIAVTPAPAAELAVLIVHEFQHLKLGALLDEYDLVELSRGRRFRVPWRPDPRPAEGTLQGVYAHLGVADLWRARSTGYHPPHDAPWADAGEQFRRYRAWTVEVAETLLDSDALTPLGTRFVSRILDTMDRWRV